MGLLDQVGLFLLAFYWYGIIDGSFDWCDVDIC